jgi:hypothetical protein
VICFKDDQINPSVAETALAKCFKIPRNPQKSQFTSLQAPWRNFGNPMKLSLVHDKVSNTRQTLLIPPVLANKIIKDAPTFRRRTIDCDCFAECGTLIGGANFVVERWEVTSKPGRWRKRLHSQMPIGTIRVKKLLSGRPTVARVAGREPP